MYKYLVSILIIVIIIIVFITWPKWGAKICPRCSQAESFGDDALNPYKESYGDVAVNPYKELYRTSSCVGTFDCSGEDFTSAGDVAANTMWQGYQYHTAIPG